MYHKQAPEMLRYAEAFHATYGLWPIAGADGADEETPPDGSAPEVDPEAPEQEDDWESRFKGIQSVVTKTQQENAEYRRIVEGLENNDPDILAKYGIEVEDDEDDADWDTDEDEPMTKAEFLEWKREQEQANQSKEDKQAFDAYVEDEIKGLDPEGSWSKQYRNAVTAYGMNNPKDGLPDFAGAHQALQAEFEQMYKGRVSSKKSPQAPTGAAPVEQLNLDNPQERREYMARKLADQQE